LSTEEGGLGYEFQPMQGFGPNGRSVAVSLPFQPTLGVGFPAGGTYAEGFVFHPTFGCGPPNVAASGPRVLVAAIRPKARINTRMTSREIRSNLVIKSGSFL
jgi:hypothetical protein